MGRSAMRVLLAVVLAVAACHALPAMDLDHPLSSEELESNFINMLGAPIDENTFDQELRMMPDPPADGEDAGNLDDYEPHAPSVEEGHRPEWDDGMYPEDDSNPEGLGESQGSQHGNTE